MFASRRVRVVAALLAGALIGCKKSPPAAAPPPASLPPLAAGEAASAVHEPSGGAMPPGHPRMGGNMGGLPPDHTPVGDPNEQRTPGGGELDPKSVVSGELKLDPKIAAKVKEGDVVFLMARADDGGGGPGMLLAVKKLAAGKWPMAFQLDSRDAMMTGTKMQGRVVVTARVDKDGDAMSKNPGDVIGKSKPIEVPAQKIVVMLDTVL